MNIKSLNMQIEHYEELVERLKELKEKKRNARSWILQEFILHLHDDTRWPAEYFKEVINFYLSDSKVIPRAIHYTHCCQEYSRTSGEKANE